MNTYFFLAVVVAGLGQNPPEKSGIVAGWDRFHGSMLLGELNCVSCHRDEGKSISVKQAPNLAEVGSRITPQFLRSFLSDPQQAKAGTPMPDLLHGLEAKEKNTKVDGLVHYLASLGGPIKQQGTSSRGRIERGKELFHSIGCVACHQPFSAPPKHKKDPDFLRDDDETPTKLESPSVPFGDLAKKTTVEALASFLADPLHVRPSGRMPNFTACTLVLKPLGVSAAMHMDPDILFWPVGRFSVQEDASMTVVEVRRG